MIAEKIKEIVKGNIFQGDNGKYYLLSRTDRKYNKRKAPVYYLSEKKGGKFVYVSGLFLTEDKGIFSYDIKDEYGLKIMKKLRLSESKIEFID